MIAPSLPQQLHFSPSSSSNYNKSATIRHHPHQHQSNAATRRRKNECHRSAKYTRTLEIIPEDQQQDASPRPCGEHNNKAALSQTHNSNAVITTDYWHSMRSMKKSATSVSLDSLASNVNEGETMNDENQISNTRQIRINYSDSNIVADNDYDNFLEDWEL